MLVADRHHQLTLCNKHDDHGNKISFILVRSTWVTAIVVFIHVKEVMGTEITIKAKESSRVPLNFSMQANPSKKSLYRYSTTIIETSFKFTISRKEGNSRTPFLSLMQ